MASTASAADATPHADVDTAALRRKLLLRTLPVCALITFVTYVDRGNLALAAPLLIPDTVTKKEYGLAASLFFLTYGSLQIPLATAFTSRAGFRRTFAVLVGLWGALTAATAAVNGPGSLYALRLLLGAAEAATLPGCFALMARFNTPAAMAVAYPTMLTFTLTSAVIGGPFGAIFIGPLDGLGGLPGWRILFLAEGVATVALACCLPWLIPETIGSATWLTPAEKEAAAAGLIAATREAGVPPPETGVAAHDGPAVDHAPLLPTLRTAFRILEVPQIWALGFNVVLSQFAFWILQFFVALEIATAFGGGGAPPPSDPRATARGSVARNAADAAAKSAIVFLPAACCLIVAGAVVRKTGNRKWVAFVSLVASGVAFAALPPVAARAGSAAGLGLLVLAAAGGTGSMGALATWPHPYLAASGRSQAAAFAAFNSFSAVSGLFGPFMAGAMPRETAFFVVAAFQFVSAALLLAFGYYEDGVKRRRTRGVEEVPLSDLTK